MAEQRSDLFKWKRRTKPKSHCSRGNVQDWIKRVQRESDAAAKEVFGNDLCGLLEQVHVDDDALVEAQDLLDSWINDKKLEDLRVEAEFSDERWAHNSTRRHLAKESPVDDGDTGIYNIHGDGSLGFKDELDDSFSRSHGAKLAGDFEEELDEEIAVQKVIRNMLDKKIVEQHIISDLGFDELKKRRNPHTKMELRHKQVKEKSDSRRKEMERSKREKSARKEAEYLARQQILREEKEKQARVKKEEADIQMEMARIRRTMEDEKKLNKEQEQCEQQKLQEAESRAHQYLEQEERKKEEKKRLKQEAKEEIRRQLLREMEEKAVQGAQEDKRILKKYFSAWYSVVVSQRIKLGKGRAMADWRCKLRAWNTWRTFVRHIRSDKEAQAIQLEMKEKHRKERLATNFHRHRLLRRSFHAWQRWVEHELEHRQLMDEHRKKADKMSALLQAAASGKLWSKPAVDGGADGSNDLRLQDIEDDDGIQVPEWSREGSRASTARRVDDFFCAPGRQAGQKATFLGDCDPRGIASLPQNTSYESTNPHRQTQQAWASQEKNNALKDRMHSHRSQPKQSKQKTTNIALEKQRTYKQVENIESLYSPDRDQSPKMRSHRPRTYSEVDSVENLHSRTVNGNITSSEKLAGKKKELKKFLSEEKLNRKTEFRTAADDVITGSHAPDGVDSGDTSARSAASGRLVSRAPVVKSAKVATKPLHLAMEERAKERAERKAVLENKRRRAEEETLARLKLQQEQQELELLKEKQDILRKKREEKRVLRERELEKQQRIESMRQLNAMAEQHYNTTLLRKYGLSPWKQLVVMSTKNMSSALNHHNRSLVRDCFYPWLEYTQKQTEQSEKAADLLNRWILLRRCWTSWRKYGQHMVRLDAVAEKYCATYLKRKFVRLWMNYVTDEQILYWEKERRADQHNEWRIKKQALIYWKKLIPLVRGEKEKEKRRDEMRRRVQSWLPDFKKSQHPSP